MSINLGDTVKDSISGFKGIATCKSEFLFGCVRFGVTPPGLHEGKPIDTAWFDEDQLVLVKKGPARVIKTANPGGPRPDAQRAKDCPVR